MPPGRPRGSTNAPGTGLRQRPPGSLPWHYTALQEASLGGTTTEIGERLHKTPAAVRVVIESPWARSYLERVQAKIDAVRIELATDPHAQLLQKVEVRLTELDALCHHANGMVALNAVRVWLEHALGKPRQRLDLTTGPLADLNLTDAEMEEVRRTGELPARVHALSAQGGPRALN